MNSELTTLRHRANDTSYMGMRNVISGLLDLAERQDSEVGRLQEEVHRQREPGFSLAMDGLAGAISLAVRQHIFKNMADQHREAPAMERRRFELEQENAVFRAALEQIENYLSPPGPLGISSGVIQEKVWLIARRALVLPSKINERTYCTICGANDHYRSQCPNKNLP